MRTRLLVPGIASILLIVVLDVYLIFRVPQAFYTQLIELALFNLILLIGSIVALIYLGWISSK
ncbi:MAG: hypothetical protein M1129_04220 [Candidatus Thermoplasmatota archaeon]|jgi:hypothetical protein|nr:hypothetical protein [Candidatus Thermoplasmatota archaeon]